MELSRNVAIIGADIATNLFSGSSALGREFKARGRKFTVIGVMKKEGKKLIDTPSNDANCMIPFGMFSQDFCH